MSAPKAGDSFPDDVVFGYVPYVSTNSAITACGIPGNYNASKAASNIFTRAITDGKPEWKGKKVVLFSVPGAFTPGCSATHLPGYIENLSKLKSKGVDVVACIAYNDPYVMDAWSKANGIKEEEILFLSDPGTKFSSKYGWTMGERTARYAMIVDNGKIVYAEKEPARDITVSSAEEVLAKL